MTFYDVATLHATIFSLPECNRWQLHSRTSW